jgi:hypothetical protein
MEQDLHAYTPVGIAGQVSTSWSSPIWTLEMTDIPGAAYYLSCCFDSKYYHFQGF